MRRKHILSLAVLVLALVGCETKEDNQIAKAQMCLDDATQNTAASCGSMVDGIESTNAYLIRCSSDFISEGFDSATIAAAFDQLQNSSGNQTTNMLSYLVFSSLNKASQAFTNCSKSGIPSMTLLAGFAQAATIIASACDLDGNPATNDCSFDPSTDRIDGMPTDQFQSGLEQLLANPDPTTLTAIGSTVVTVYNAQCSNSANNQSDICSEIVKAMNGATDPLTIAQNLLNNLKN